MNQLEQKKRAQEFAEKWQGRGDEKQDAQNFWRDLLVNVLGVPSTSITSFISFERKVQGGFIDGFIEDTGVLIEQKSLGVDLTKAKPQSDGTNLTPYGQAVRYAAKLPLSIRPRWIICSNFEQFLIYDQETDPAGENPHVLMLADLPSEFYRLAFITDKSNSRLEKEKTLSVKAGAVVGKLYNSFAEQYQNIDTDEQEQKSLNVLIVRLVFLLYAEDAGLLQHHGALYDYLKPIPVPQMRQAIIDLFKVLNTPDGTGGTQDERDPYMNPELLAFPYINGGLFSDEALIIPQFTDQIKLDLLVEASSKFDWAEVSPTIFGAVFESTLNPETRHEGGMHYTSVENIHKVIDPLFLDELRGKLEKIEALKSDRDRRIRLKAFQNELASITVFDPACGSGNFLTESYLSLRKLENRVLENLQGEQTSFEVGGDSSIIKVKLSQFYGIEINDFAVSVAKTALWIAESQMIEATQEIVLQVLDFLPLKSNSNIIEGNALTMDWENAISAQECSYIVGNPPFLGARTMDAQQKEDLQRCLDGARNSHDIDYVGGWYVKSAQMMEDNPRIRAALVSTNSICQGAQPANLWAFLMGRYRIGIDFAWRTFIWNNEASDQAHVHCVIVGFSRRDKPKGGVLFGSDGEKLLAKNINAYLLDAPDIFVEDSKKPICNAPLMANGNQPRDGGNLVLKPDEAESLIAAEPGIERFIRPYIGSEEFIKGKDRYCIWLEDAQQSEIEASPALSERVKAVYEFRAASKAKTTNGYAKTPALFAQRPQKQGVDFLLLPMTSSERRAYLPIGYMNKSVVASNAVFVIPDATLYHFGVLTSQAHNAWMRVVAGRLKSDYRYSKEIVYNDFPWPGIGSGRLDAPVSALVLTSAREAVEGAAKVVLEARASHPGKTMAELYDPDKMPADLMEAHAELDRAVERAYGVAFDGDEEKMVAHLFKLYAEATKE